MEPTPASASGFLVEVRYREPGYEARTGGPRAEPYRFRYRIAAADEATATGRALAEFHAIARLSSVGWTREIVEVLVVRDA